VVAARHDACGAATRVRLPGTVPARAVRRLRCAGCEQAFETEQVEELELEPAVAQGPAAPQVPAPPQQRRRPSLPSFDPQSRAWRLASIPIAAALVIAGLLLAQGDNEPVTTEPEPSGERPAEGGEPASGTQPSGGGGAATGEGGAAGGEPELVRGSAFSLALPAGWEQIDPDNGATFAATADDGGADVTLWIEEDPELKFPAFVTQSLRQLEQLAGSARVVERVPAPTPEGTVVVLAADSPAGEPTYEVTLRAAGPYRYYLATSVQPDASAVALGGAELIAGSFTPEVGGE
jgi:hypothetical protein